MTDHVADSASKNLGICVPWCRALLGSNQVEDIVPQLSSAMSKYVDYINQKGVVTTAAAVADYFNFTELPSKALELSINELEPYTKRGSVTVIIDTDDTLHAILVDGIVERSEAMKNAINDLDNFPISPNAWRYTQYAAIRDMNVSVPYFVPVDELETRLIKAQENVIVQIIED